MTVTHPAPDAEATVDDAPDGALPTPSATADDFAERIFGAVLAAQEVQAAYLGDRLGYYEALAARGPLTSVELAEATGTAERYTREWLEHQAAAAWLEVDDPSAPPTERRFAIPAAHVEVLIEAESLAYALPFARFVAGLGLHLPKLVDAYRSGEGVSWEELGEDPREAQAAANRPLFVNALGSEVVPAMPDVHQRLAAGGRVADVGCGLGWSSIGLARAFPDVTVDGYDVDEASVLRARANAEAEGLAHRVRFHHVDAAQVDPATIEGGAYDLVTAFECIHDLPHPVEVLGAMGRLAGDDGAVLVMDERVGEAFTGPADDVERLLYGFSITCCLPDGLSHEHSVGTGTVMRASTFSGYASAAGFRDVEVLDVDNEFFRFYRLHGRSGALAEGADR